MGIVNFHDSFLQRYCVDCCSNARSCDRAHGQGFSTFAHGVKAFEESVFRPCTLWRTWGTVLDLGPWFADPTSNDLIEMGLSDDLLVVESGQLAVEGCGAWLRRSC